MTENNGNPGSPELSEEAWLGAGLRKLNTGKLRNADGWVNPDYREYIDIHVDVTLEEAIEEQKVLDHLKDGIEPTLAYTQHLLENTAGNYWKQHAKVIEEARVEIEHLLLEVLRERQKYASLVNDVNKCKEAFLINWYKAESLYQGMQSAGHMLEQVLEKHERASGTE
jgi:hypothetical protein